MKSKLLKRISVLMLAAAVTVPAASFTYLPVSAEIAITSSWTPDSENEGAVLSRDIKTAFDEAAASYREGTLIPLAKYASQVVAGHNYYFICRHISNDGTVSLKKVVVYDPNFDYSSGYHQKARINHVEDFDLENYEHDYTYYLSDREAPGSAYISTSGECDLPDDVSAVFDSLYLYMDGKNYTPLAYLGKKSDSSGTDYAILCHTYAVVPMADEFIDVVIIHKDTNGRTYQKTSCSILGTRRNYNNIPLENHSYIWSDEIVIGDYIDISVKGYGGSHDYQYEVLYKKKTEKKWTAAKNYNNSPDSDIISIKPAKATDYDVCVKVTDSNGDTAKKFFTVKVNQKLKNTSTLSAATIKKGSTVTVKGSASGGVGDYTYAVFYKKKSEKKWTVKQDYSTNSKMTIKPSKNTDYDICIKVQDSSGNISKKYFSLTVN